MITNVPKLNPLLLKQMGFVVKHNSIDEWGRIFENGLNISVNVVSGKGWIGSHLLAFNVLNTTHLKWFLEALVGGIYFKKK